MVPLATKDIPPNVQRVSFENGLGDLVAVYPRVIQGLLSFIYPILSSLFGMAILIYGLIGHAQFGVPQSALLISLIGILFLLPIFVWYLIILVRKWTLTIYLFQEGIIIVETGRCLVFPWRNTSVNKRWGVFRVQKNRYRRGYQLESVRPKSTRYKLTVTEVRNAAELSTIIRNRYKLAERFDTVNSQ